MIVITDCLTEKVDEGCLKVANSLVKRIKKSDSKSVIISYGRESKDTDIYLNLNKLFLNKALYTEINKHEGNILYIPFSSNTFASILRTTLLSILSKRKVKVLFALRHSMNKISEFLLKIGKFEIITLSRKSFDFYNQKFPNRVLYLKTGVDIQQFYPVSDEKKRSLKQKYCLDETKPVVIHVGHLHNGRNVEVLNGIREGKQVLLVISSVTEQDQNLWYKLEKNNVRIIDEYIPEIQEIYQLSDAYIFPVMEEENSIDVPLSVLEAAACNIPIVATRYGELNEFINEKGFIFLDDCNLNNIDNAVNKVLQIPNVENCNVVKEYDWNYSSNILSKWMND